MSFTTDSQLGSLSAPRHPVFRTAGVPSDESASFVGLELEPLGSEVSLAVLHQSHLEPFLPNLADAFRLCDNASEKRRNELLLGRAAARLALIRAGLANPSPVMRRVGGDPDWPAGIVGSITHCAPWAIAAVASSSRVKALGIDLEDVLSVPETEIAEAVCRSSELRWVFEARDSQLRTAMLFSAKESVYKALYPKCQKFFDFHAVELTWLAQESRFRGVLFSQLNAEFSPGFCFEVHCQQLRHFVFTYLTIRADDCASQDNGSRSSTRWNERRTLAAKAA
jgi:enterobactin synthetase component D / holo-[acyl-carrier protein] synthase